MCLDSKTFISIRWNSCASISPMKNYNNFSTSTLFEMSKKNTSNNQSFGLPLHIPDNTAYIEMVEDATKGFFTLLDSACKAPQPSIEAWMQELMKTHEVHPRNQRKKGGPKEKLTGFMLIHFADNVTYDSTNFLIKNNEAVHSRHGKNVGQVYKSTGFNMYRKLVLVKVEEGEIENKANIKKKMFDDIDNLKKKKTRKINVLIIGAFDLFRIFECIVGFGLSQLRVPYNTLYETYHSTVNNPLIRNMGPGSFSTALLIAFDVSEDDYELGFDKESSSNPAKAA
ncbi:myosin-Vb, partial [Reticulomyxa filosa]